MFISTKYMIVSISLYDFFFQAFYDLMRNVTNCKLGLRSAITISRVPRKSIKNTDNPKDVSQQQSSNDGGCCQIL